jgi:hypothetical protein
VGTALGVYASFWAQRRLRRQIERYAPDRVVRQAATSVRRLVDEVRAAAADGRAAMHDREASLRAQFRTPGSW